MTGSASPGPRICGSLRAVEGTGVVRIEDRYDTDIDDLWSAITDPVRLARWHGQLEGDLRPGGEFRLYLAADDIDSTGRIDACEPPRRLVVTTRETDESYRKGQGVPPFDAVKEITLTPDGDQTVLVLEVRGMPLDKIAFFGAGWQIHTENLAAHIGGREPIDVGARWEELVPPYQELAAKIS
ncbi:MAG TPA: SRPBCC family protein [Gaiellaceae bacterium]|nr:SRPBCC family protein [Gaiellaceae bacterium]